MAACQEDLLTEVNATFIRVSFRRGFVLERWSASMQYILQKNNLPYIDKLRIVQLFEAVFKSALKDILGRKYCTIGRSKASTAIRDMNLDMDGPLTMH